jgi:hypothetical protein
MFHEYKNESWKITVWGINSCRHDVWQFSSSLINISEKGLFELKLFCSNFVEEKLRFITESVSDRKTYFLRNLNIARL